MLKKLFFLLICIKLCATKSPDEANLSRIALTAGIISISTSTLALCAPNVEHTRMLMLCANAGVVTLGCATGALAAIKLYPIGKEIYESIFPNEQQKAIQNAKTIESRKKLALLKAEEEFRNCLLNCSPDCEKNDLGIPTACQEAARILSMLGAQSEVDQMKKIFNTYGK